eukprot:2253554-Pleurochrysis_carterae.AAC.1
MGRSEPNAAVANAASSCGCRPSANATASSEIGANRWREGATHAEIAAGAACRCTRNAHAAERINGHARGPVANARSLCAVPVSSSESSHRKAENASGRGSGMSAQHAFDVWAGNSRQPAGAKAANAADGVAAPRPFAAGVPEWPALRPKKETRVAPAEPPSCAPSGCARTDVTTTMASAMTSAAAVVSAVTTAAAAASACASSADTPAPAAPPSSSPASSAPTSTASTTSEVPVAAAAPPAATASTATPAAAAPSDATPVAAP